MKKVFVDTSAWIALNSKDDKYHNEACFLNQKLIVEEYGYVTTNFVLDETYTFLRYEVSHRKAVELAHEITELEGNGKVEVVYISREIAQLALKIFEQYGDKNFSFTDCTSFVVMNQLGLIETFTFDHHFEQYGLVQLRESKTA